MVYCTPPMPETSCGNKAANFSKGVFEKLAALFPQDVSGMGGVQ